MKVTFKHGIKAFSGTIDEATFMPTPRGTGSFMRKWVYPRLTEHNHAIGAATTNLAGIWKNTSNEYKANMDTYCDLHFTYISDPLDQFATRISMFAMFTKMMYAFAESSSGQVDLATIKYDDLTTLFPDVTSVAAAAAAGFLPEVPGVGQLTESF